MNKEKDCCVLFYINSLLTTVKMHWFVDLEIIKGEKGGLSYDNICNIYSFLCTTCIWFPLNSLSSSSANHLKFIHMMLGTIKGTPSLILDFTTFPVLELCPCLLEVGASMTYEHILSFFYSQRMLNEVFK
jgi:hypothetical protein